MPTYKVLSDSYINDRLVPASTDDAPVLVAYDGNPGANLEPVDDEGRARQAAYFAARGRTAEEADRLHHVPPLAARLGAPVDVTTRAAAETIIKAELARRAGG